MATIAAVPENGHLDRYSKRVSGSPKTMLTTAESMSPPLPPEKNDLPKPTNDRPHDRLTKTRAAATPARDPGVAAQGA